MGETTFGTILALVPGFPSINGHLATNIYGSKAQPALGLFETRHDGI